MKRGDAVIYGLVAAAAAAIVWWSFSGNSGGTAVDVKMPELSNLAKAGQGAFADNCSVCHGQNASGSDKGPPLIHIVYEPSHHGDASFYAAAQRGVRAHHWRFGDMAPVEGLTRADVKMIVAYVRELQRENGIE